MPKFSVDWQMLREDRFFTKEGQIFWSKVLSPEWTVMCVCSLYKPFLINCIEIHRQSNVGECLISGALDLYCDKKHIVRKNFLQSVESGTSFTQMELVYSSSNAISPDMLSVAGDIAIYGTQINSLIDFVNMEDATRSECLFELSDDFGHLLNVQSFSDINIKCGGITIPSHKSILSARSSVFATMIHNKQMREGIEHEMDIFDTDISVLKIMLLHMYTGKIGYSTVSQALDVLIAADKYQLLGLKKACCNFLKEMVSIDNAIEILIIADMVAPDLKGFVVEFLCKKCEFSVLQESEHWKMLERTHRSVSIEVLNTLVRDREQKLKECKYLLKI